MAKIPSSLSRLFNRVGLFDVVAGGAAPLIAVLIREPTYFSRTSDPSVFIYSGIALGATLFSILYFRVGQILSRYLSMTDVKQLLKAAVAASLITSGVAFTVMRLDAIPRSMPILHFLTLSAMLVGVRALLSEHYRRAESQSASSNGEALENVILIGATRLAWLYIRMLGCVADPHQRVIALVDDNPRLRGRSMCGLPIVGSVRDLDAVLTEYATHGVAIDRLVVTYSDLPQLMASESALMEAVAPREVAIEYLSDRLNLGGAERFARDPVVEKATITPPSSAAAYWRFRRVSDIVLAVAAILLLSPLLAFTTLLVLMDVGSPAVFWQERMGRFGRRISVHKFRTLRAPVDRAGQIVPDCERLSPIGRFLRATRLDELPQLFDILGGEMTLIGPRPLLPVDMPKSETVRLQAPPGITGWAQVNGGKLITAEEKNALDEWYIFHVSPLVDLQILRLTLMMPFRGDRRRERVILRALQFREERLKAGKAGSATVEQKALTQD